MSGLVQYLTDGYQYLFVDSVHPMSRHFFLVGNPLGVLLLIAAYNYLCLSLGPRLMQNRRPFELKNTLLIYNLFQIIISIYLFYEAAIYVFSEEFDFRCSDIDDPSSSRAAKIAPKVWLFFIVKIIDLLDTVFFVLRKSNRQITALHMHHHSLMPIVTWIAITYFPGGQSIIIGFVNSFVHAVMYFYYLLSGLGEKYRKSLWWKKYITMLQLVQFMVLLLQSVTSLFYECGYPLLLKILIMTYALIFLNMFGKFYYYSYVKEGEKHVQGIQNGTDKVKNQNHKLKNGKDL